MFSSQGILKNLEYFVDYIVKTIALMYWLGRVECKAAETIEDFGWGKNHSVV